MISFDLWKVSLCTQSNDQRLPDWESMPSLARWCNAVAVTKRFPWITTNVLASSQYCMNRLLSKKDLKKTEEGMYEEA